MSAEVMDGTVVNIEPQKEAPSDPPLEDVQSALSDPPIEDVKSVAATTEETKAVDPPVENAKVADPPVENAKAVVQKNDPPKVEAKPAENGMNKD